METCLWPTVDHVDPPDLPRHGCYSDRGPAASGGQTVLANDRNGGRLRLNASRHDDDGPLVCYHADAVSSEESIMLCSVTKDVLFFLLALLFYYCTALSVLSLAV